MDFIGDYRCKYNALSAYLRCSVNPSGPCEGCPNFEQVREKLMFQGRPIAPTSWQDILIHNVKVKVFYIWSVVCVPVGMLQAICALTLVGLLISNKYPISKEQFLESFQQSNGIVGQLYMLRRAWDVATEFHFSSIHRTSFNKFLRLALPVIWCLVFDITVKLLLHR
jgi:Family of unknown function (DUF6464)